MDIPIQIFGEHLRSELIISVFQSLSNDSETLIVYLYPDGEIKAERVPHQKPVYHVHPITRQEWRMDSQEALNRLLDEDKTRLLKRSKINCSDLSLEHKDRTENSVIWILSIFDCGDMSSSVFYYLDPITGEVDEFIR